MTDREYKIKRQEYIERGERYYANMNNGVDLGPMKTIEELHVMTHSELVSEVIRLREISQKLLKDEK